MAGKELQNPLKPIEWKNMGNETNATATAATAANSKTTNGQPIVKKRLPKKFRELPEHYFIPRKSIPAGIAFYGSFIVAGVGCAMLMEGWINKKIKEDGGGVVWEFK